MSLYSKVLSKYFPINEGRTKNDCAIVSLYFTAKLNNIKYSFSTIKNLCIQRSNGVSLYSLHQAAKEIGFNSVMVKISQNKIQEINAPSIALIDNNHFIVILEVFYKKYILYFDPKIQEITKISYEKFMSRWTLDKVKNEGVLLLLEI